MDVNMVAILLENGIGLNHKNADGDTAAHILMRCGRKRFWRQHGSWFPTNGLSNYV